MAVLRSILLLAAIGFVQAFDGCYKGPKCAGKHGCCDCCSQNTAQTCAAAGGTWMSSCTDAYCALSGTTNGEACVADPPAPPAPPPPPPKPCITLGGTKMPKTTAASPDPVNEPCYTHSSCKKYSAEGSGYVCCVKKGTCDSIVSSTQDYYVGGCRGLNYKWNTSHIGDASGSDAFPSTVDGCYKQGECVTTYLEQEKDWTHVGGGLPHVEVSDAVMSTLLEGSISTPPGECRKLYPFNEVFVPTKKVVSTVTAAGEVADYTEAVTSEMENKIADALGVRASFVEVTVASGSVVITISVSVEDEAAASAMATSMDTAMGTTQAASALLSTSGLTITASAVGTAASAPTNEPPSAPPPDNSLSTGAVAGIAIGASLFVIIVIVIAIVMKKKKTAQATTKGVGA